MRKSRDFVKLLALLIFIDCVFAKTASWEKEKPKEKIPIRSDMVEIIDGQTIIIGKSPGVEIKLYGVEAPAYKQKC